MNNKNKKNKNKQNTANQCSSSTQLLFSCLNAQKLHPNNNTLEYFSPHGVVTAIMADALDAIKRKLLKEGFKYGSEDYAFAIRNAKVNNTLEKQPHRLPPGWKVYHSEKHDRNYFYSKTTGKKVWTVEEAEATDKQTPRAKAPKAAASEGRVKTTLKERFLKARLEQSYFGDEGQTEQTITAKSERQFNTVQSALSERFLKAQSVQGYASIQKEGVDGQKQPVSLNTTPETLNSEIIKSALRQQLLKTTLEHGGGQGHGFGRVVGEEKEMNEYGGGIEDHNTEEGAKLHISQPAKPASKLQSTSESAAAPVAVPESAAAPAPAAAAAAAEIEAETEVVFASASTAPAVETAEATAGIVREPPSRNVFTRLHGDAVTSAAERWVAHGRRVNSLSHSHTLSLSLSLNTSPPPPCLSFELEDAE
jgi:hypothetical protein